MRSVRRTGLLVFLASMAVYNLNGRFIGGLDSLPARLLPISLLTTGTLYLDRFEPTFPTDPAHRYWLMHARSGHLVSLYPVVVPVLVTPLFVPAAFILESGNVSSRWFLRAAEISEKVSASVIAASSAAVMFVLLRRLARPAHALLLTATYAFATETWVIGSQALWQHGLAELLLAATLLALLVATPTALSFAGVLSGLLIANRPPDAAFSMAAAAYVLFHHRRHLLPFLACATAALSPFLAYSYVTFGHPLGGYGHAVGRHIFTLNPTELIDGTAGLLVSPAKGLLLFAPFFLFLPASLWAPMSPTLGRLLVWFLPAAAAVLLFYGASVVWWGGSCYGPRYLTDMTPVLIVALVPIVEALRRPWARALFVALVAFGIGVQAIGAFCYPMGGSDANTDRWSLQNVAYVNEARARLGRRPTVP